MQKTEYWQNMIKAIHKDTESILDDHLRIFKFYVEIVNGAPEKVRNPFTFHDFVRRQHGVAVALFIRRQLDDKKYNSLYRLLCELIQDPKLITVDWYKKTFNYDWASADFKQFTSDGMCLDPAIPKKDRKILIQLGKKIDDYVDKNIAHNTNKIPLKVTYDDIDNFLKAFEKILIKYIMLFTGAGYVEIAPIYQYDWSSIFHYPWILEDHGA